MKRRVDVVIPAYQSWDTLERTLDALESQVVADDRGVFVVDSSGDRDAADLEARWPWVRFILLPERTLPGRARNLAAAASDAELLAFLDADAVPDANWLDNLLGAIGDGVAVAGAIENGTPDSATGTAQYLLEFAEWLPERRRGIVHAATCNLLVRRDAFLATGGFDEDVWPGEDTIVSLRWGQAGQLAFAPTAIVHHLNRTGFRPYLAHQVRLGGSFLQVSRRTGFPYAFLGHRGWAPLAAAARILALYRQLAPAPIRLRRAVSLAPLVVLGLAAWAYGFAAGRKPKLPTSRALDHRYWDAVADQADGLPLGWRRHARRAHLDLVDRWVGETSGRWLKTDVAEELSPARALLSQLPGDWFALDVSPRACAAATRGQPVRAVAADVTRLPYASGSFSGVLSTSTLDHFASATSISAALRELRRVLRIDGTLVLTLDNPANPLLALRNRLPRRAQLWSGLVPFEVGATLDGSAGSDALRRAGFEVETVEYLLHAPHIVGTRLARFSTWEMRVLPLLDRLAHTRLAPRTGHFVAFRARAVSVG